MKRWILMLYIIGIGSLSMAQKTKTVLLKQANIHLKEMNSNSLNELMDKQNFEESVYVVLYFKTPSVHSEVKAIAEKRIELIRYISPQCYIASIQKDINVTSLEQLNVQYIGQIPAKSKIDHHLSKKQGQIKIFIQLFESQNKRIESILTRHGNVIRHPYLATSNRIYFETDANELPHIARLPFVEYIQAATMPQLLVNENAAVHSVNYLQHNTGFQLTGSGIVVGIGDGGTINTHLDLNTRHLNREATDDSPHAALVTGIVAGDGTLNYRKSGLAPQANIVAEYFGNIINKTSDYFSAYDMSLANHSYGNGYAGSFCDNAGNYDIFSQEIDQNTIDFPKILHFVAAGNSGGSTCTPYPASFHTVLNGIQSAKNVMTVGASMDNDVIWSPSSRGPVTDGRIKPEIVAIGVNVRGTSTTNNYTTSSGTSFAAPTATGCAALLSELYKQEHQDSLPDAALLKAILCNSADDLGNIGPDYIYGFGRLNAKKAAKIIETKAHFSDSLAQSQEKSFQIQVPANTERLKVMLTWADPAASPLAVQTLINNLDIEIEAPNASIHYPWLLDTTATQVANTAFKGDENNRDSINNIEQITIENPMTGTYTIKVVGTQIPMGHQAFHVVYELVEKELELTHPLGGEITIPAADLLITWNDTIGFEGDSLQLYYTLNAGLNWTQIGQTFAADHTQYTFSMPDTSSNQAQIRITNKTGTFADTSGLFSNMRRPSLTATPNCDSIIELTWSAVNEAVSYDLYQYIAGDWTFIHSTGDLNHTVTGLNVGEEYCFSAKAISASGVESGLAVGRCVVAFGNPVVSYPYQEDFEDDHGNWFSLGKNNDWEWGVPNNILISCAADGDKAWVTDLDSNYTDASLGYLYSPCFDLSTLTTPVLSFSLWLDVEDTSTVYDYLQLQYSRDGLSWSRLGVNGEGYHWYNNLGGYHIWDGTTNNWQQARYNIPATGTNIRFRFVLNSDAFTNQEGVGIDNIYIYDAAEKEHFIQLQAKVVLEGAYNSNTSLMHDSLQQQNQIPLTEPYSNLFRHSGNETISDPNILNTTGNDAIFDWVFIELRDKTDHNVVLATRAALVQKDGDVVDTDGSSPVKFYGVEANDFHVAVKYRNHLGIMTDGTVELANILLRK